MLPESLEDVQIRCLPDTAFYIADFITEAEEDILLKKVASAPKPRWKELTHRRLQVWPSDLTQNTLIDSPLPEWLTDPIVSRILSIPRFSIDGSPNIFSDSPHCGPNHVLINEYRPGKGIMPHKDGPAYHPLVCTVSLGASLCLDIYGCTQDGTRELERQHRILQEPRSLLIMTHKLYTQYMHGIADLVADIDLNPDTVSNWSLLRSPESILNGTNERRTRTSLTYRDVNKVAKLGKKFAMFGKR